MTHYNTVVRLGQAVGWPMSTEFPRQSRTAGLRLRCGDDGRTVGTGGRLTVALTVTSVRAAVTGPPPPAPTGTGVMGQGPRGRSG